MSDFNSQQELMFYLSSDSDNRVINTHTEAIEGFSAGRLVAFVPSSRIATSYDNLEDYQSYSKYTKPCWKEAINEKPIFAFTSNDDMGIEWSEFPTIICLYDKSLLCSFIASASGAYRYIKPATKEEIEVYINNIPEV